MPRSARIVLPNLPHHVRQRGHNRQVVFVNADDYRIYLANLREWAQCLSIRLYAYCLMTNHVHLVVDPGESPDRLAKLMKRVAARQTRWVNRIEGRTGTLWEGRYRSSPIETESYLGACCRYVELNPVRARLVRHPSDYPWSSYRERTSPRSEWLDEDPFYATLGALRQDRARAWSKFVDAEISPGELDCIRQSIQRCQPTGSERFAVEVSRRIGRRIVLRGPGRPRKAIGK